MNIRDKTGQRFGRLFVLHRDEGRRLHWICQCDCGEIVSVQSNNLASGNTSSCGCLQREKAREYAPGGRPTHGMYKTRVYTIWVGMIQRTRNPNIPNWHNYGGRGIRICDRWLRFENFLADMGEPPAGLSIDRINNDGNYEPGNCRWATAKEQIHNRRVTKKR